MIDGWGSKWHFGCWLCVECCAGYLVAGGVLVVTVQAKSEPGHTHLIIPVTPHPQRHQVFPPPYALALFPVVFAVAV